MAQGSEAMADWFLIFAIIVAAGGIAFLLFRNGRDRRGRGRDPDIWIGGDGSTGSYDSGASSWSATDSGAAPAPDFSGGGGDFGGGGASGGWDDGGGSDSGGGDGGGGSDGGGGDGGGGGD
jgi:uncharacterized membrane protein YgcG